MFPELVFPVLTGQAVLYLSLWVVAAPKLLAKLRCKEFCLIKIIGLN